MTVSQETHISGCPAEVKKFAQHRCQSLPGTGAKVLKFKCYCSFGLARLHTNALARHFEQSSLTRYRAADSGWPAGVLNRLRLSGEGGYLLHRASGVDSSIHL